MTKSKWNSGKTVPVGPLYPLIHIDLLKQMLYFFEWSFIYQTGYEVKVEK